MKAKMNLQLGWVLATALAAGAWTTDLRGGEAAGSPEIRMPEYTTAVLPNGMTLLLMERRELPLINVAWVLRSGGAICDPQGREGLASLTAQMLRKGTAGRSAEQISAALDFIGASFEAGAGLDYASGNMEFMSKDAQTALGLLADTLTKPVFPDDEVRKLVTQEVDGIAEAKESPMQVLGSYFQRFLFAPHPYGRPAGGTEQTLPALTREHVRDFHARQYVPDQLLLAVVGDFRSPEMRQRVEETFRDWKRGDARVPKLESPSPVKGRRVLMVEKPDSTQTFFALGNIGPARTSPDWAPLSVVNTLFGGRFTSMINTELRINSGLTYGARSSFSPHPVAGSFTVASYTRNDTTREAIEKTLAVLGALRDKGITEAQLASAKAYMKGQFGPTLETNDQLAARIVELAFYGLGPDEVNRLFERIDSVTVEKAQQLIREYYPLENLAITLIGQANVIQPVAGQLSTTVERKKITEPGF